MGEGAALLKTKKFRPLSHSLAMVNFALWAEKRSCGGGPRGRSSRAEEICGESRVLA